MSETFIQEDFGGFNPRFLGVTLKFGSPQAFNAFLQFLMTDTLPSGQSPLSEISIRSVLDHEVRHFHDFLLSPYSAVIFRMRLQAAVNGMTAVQIIRETPGTHLPVPLTRWIRMPVEQRAEYLAEWSELFHPKAFSIVDLPFLSDESLEPKPGETIVRDLPSEALLPRSLDATCRAYLRIGELTSGFTQEPDHPELVPYAFYEVVALATQMQTIWNSQEVGAFELFLENLKSLPLPYARLWRTIGALVEGLQAEVSPTRNRKPPPLIDQMAAIALWCLLGNYQAEGESACPTIRFLDLLAHLRKTPSSHDVDPDIRTRWNHWDQATGVQPWPQSLTAMLENNQRGLAQYESLAFRKEAPPILAQAMRRYVQDQQQFVQRLLHNPNDLAEMNLYVNGPSAELPRPVVRLELESFVYRVAATENTAFKALHILHMDGVEVACDFALQDLSPDFDQRLSEAMELESLMHPLDLLFSDHAITTNLLPQARATAESLTGKKLLHLV